MSEHIDFELAGDRRVRLTSEGDLLVPPDVPARLPELLLSPLALLRTGKAEAGYRFAEVELCPPGSLPALRAVLDRRLAELGLEGRTEPPLPPPEADGWSGDPDQDVVFERA